VDQSDFFMGKQEKSNREGFIVYMGNDIFGVKWRDWKLNFAEMDSALSDKKTYNFMKTYNLLTDPAETESRTVPDSWVAKAGLAQFVEHLDSLEKHPPIPTGTLDPYEPPE
jgi:arylsulfatase